MAQQPVRMRRCAVVQWTTVGASTVVHDPRSHVTHVLDAPATSVWSALDGAASPADVAVRVAARWSTSPAEITADVEGALATFAENGLLQTGPSQPVLRAVSAGTGATTPAPAPAPISRRVADARIRSAAGPRRAGATTVDVVSVDAGVRARAAAALRALPPARGPGHLISVTPVGERDPRWAVELDGRLVDTPATAAGAVAVARSEIDRLTIESWAGRRLLLHAGAVEAGGRAVVVAGRSGAGKSTLVAALARRGWRYLTDEVVAIEPGGWTIEPYPKAIDLDDRSLAALDMRERREPARGKQPFCPEGIGIVSTGARVASLVLLDPGSDDEAGAPGATTVDPLTALVDLLDATFAPTMQMPTALDALADLVRAVPPTRLPRRPVHQMADAAEAALGAA